MPMPTRVQVPDAFPSGLQLVGLAPEIKVGLRITVVFFLAAFCLKIYEPLQEPCVPVETSVSSMATE